MMLRNTNMKLRAIALLMILACVSAYRPSTLSSRLNSSIRRRLGGCKIVPGMDYRPGCFCPSCQKHPRRKAENDSERAASASREVVNNYFKDNGRGSGNTTTTTRPQYQQTICRRKRRRYNGDRRL